jgi:hypothetical protein
VEARYLFVRTTDAEMMANYSTIVRQLLGRSLPRPLVSTHVTLVFPGMSYLALMGVISAKHLITMKVSLLSLS